MQARNKKVETTSIISMACFAVLVAFFAESFKEATLLLMISGLNIVGLYYGEKYGRLVTLLCLLSSGMFLQRSQVRPLLFVLCAMVSITGLVLMEQWEPVKRQRNSDLGHDLPLPPELLAVLFGSSMSSKLRNPDRKWLSLALHGVLQHVAPLKIPQFDIGGKLPLFSTRTCKNLSVKEVREGILAKETANSQNTGASPSGASDAAQAAPPSSSGIFGSIMGAFSSTGGDNAEEISARETSHIGPTGGFNSVIDFSYVADENTKIEVEIPMTLPLWGTMSVPVMVASPEISGSVQLEFRHDVIKGEDGKTLTKVLAIGIMFEPIKEIHIHGIHISKASQFQLIQYVPIVKNYMKQAVNSALIPDTRRVLLFDASFSSLGSFLLEKDEVWNIDGLLYRLKHPSEEDQKAKPSTTQSGLESTSNPSTGSPNLIPSFPVLDLSNADVQSFESTDPSSSAQRSVDILSSTEFDADVPVGMEPGEPRELTSTEAANYPTLQLT